MRLTLAYFLKIAPCLQTMNNSLTYKSTHACFRNGGRMQVLMLLLWFSVLVSMTGDVRGVVYDYSEIGQKQGNVSSGKWRLQ